MFVRLTGSDDGEKLGWRAVEQEFEVTCELELFRPECRHAAGFIEDCKRGTERGHGQDRGIAQLPGVRRPHRQEFRLELHAKARCRVVATPTGKPRKLAVGRVALVDERAGDRARPGVEIFVGTPDGEVDVPIVQRERDIAGCMCQIDPDDATALLRQSRSSRDIEELAGEKIYSGEKNERDLIAVFFE